MASEFGIEVLRAGAELRISGRLDGRSASAVRTALQSAIDGGAGEVVVHVPELEIWDAGGLGVLVGAQRRARHAGRHLVLTDVSARQLRLFRAVRLHRVLGVEPAPGGAEHAPGGAEHAPDLTASDQLLPVAGTTVTRGG
jgi:anti-sigma B factor antagonist